MARFYGTLQGSRGPASRLGTPSSGLYATAAGWNLGGFLRMAVLGETDSICLGIDGGSNGRTPSVSFGTWTLADLEVLQGLDVESVIRRALGPKGGKA